MSGQASITAQPGRLLALYFGSGTSPFSYVLVGGLRATDITINGNPVDITSKSSAGWRELLPGAGITSCDISASGVYDSSNTNLKTIQQAAINSAGGGAPTYIHAKIQSGAGDSFVGVWAVETFKRSGTHNDAEMYDITLRSHGAVTLSP